MFDVFAAIAVFSSSALLSTTSFSSSSWEQFHIFAKWERFLFMTRMKEKKLFVNEVQTIHHLYNINKEGKRVHFSLRFK